ncbi:unnamed protein product [Arctogadus glacialis]
MNVPLISKISEDIDKDIDQCITKEILLQWRCDWAFSWSWSPGQGTPKDEFIVCLNLPAEFYHTAGIHLNYRRDRRLARDGRWNLNRRLRGILKYGAWIEYSWLHNLRAFPMELRTQLGSP